MITNDQALKDSAGITFMCSDVTSQPTHNSWNSWNSWFPSRNSGLIHPAAFHSSSFIPHPFFLCDLCG